MAFIQWFPGCSGKGRFQAVQEMKELEIQYLAGLLREYRELHKPLIRTPDAARRERMVARQVDKCLAAYQKEPAYDGRGNHA